VAVLQKMDIHSKETKHTSHEKAARTCHEKWVLGAPSPGVKRQGCETGHSPLSSAEVKNHRAIPPLRHTSSWCGA
jgi:hypothetical protein